VISLSMKKVNEIDFVFSVEIRYYSVVSITSPRFKDYPLFYRLTLGIIAVGCSISVT
jgi:hypothetical protein